MSQLQLRYRLGNDGELAGAWLGTADGELDITQEVVRIHRHVDLGLPAQGLGTDGKLYAKWNPTGEEVVAIALRGVDVVGVDEFGNVVYAGKLLKLPPESDS